MAQDRNRNSSCAGAGSIELVQRRWDDLALRKGCDAPAAAATREALLRAHGEPHRHYHTLDHVAVLLVLLDRHADAGSDCDALILAILFHDAIYDPARQDNEAASAAFAASRLTKLGFSADLVGKVVRCILATRHGQDATALDDADVALLLDLDLSILAAPPDLHRSYAQAIRREYAHVPDALYRAGRGRVLEGFLARERIYLTERLRGLWEEPARANLAAELTELATGARLAKLD